MKKVGSFLLPAIVLALTACGLGKGHMAASGPMDTTALSELYYAGEMNYLNGNLSGADSAFSRYVRGNFRTAPGWFRLACIAHDRGQNEKAASLIQTAINTDSSVREFYMRQAEIYLSMGNYAVAGAVYEKLALKSPRGYTLWLDASRCYQYSGRYSDMLRTCRKWEESFGLLEQIIDMKSTAWRGTGNNLQAAMEWQRLVHKYPDRRQYRLKLAEGLNSAGRQDRARAIYDSLLLDNPQDGAVLSVLCRYYTQTDTASRLRYARSLAALTQTPYNTKWECINNLVMARDTRWYDSLGSALETLSTQHPAEIQAQNEWGRWLLRHGKTAEAAAIFERSLRSNTSDLHTWQNYMDALAARCDYRRMRAAADTLAELYPSLSRPYYYQAWAEMLAGNYQNATAAAETGISFAPDPETALPCRIILARILNRQGLKDKAMQTCEQIIAAYPADAEARHAMAEIRLNAGNATAALQELNKISGEALYDPWLQITLHQTRTALGQPSAHLAAAAARMPDCPYVLELQGDALKNAGRCEQALKYYQQAACPQYPNQKAVLDKINQCKNR